jgi:hypothetical protein
MDNDPTLPAGLTQPGGLPGRPQSESIKPVYLVILISALLLVAALIYFV